MPRILRPRAVDVNTRLLQFEMILKSEICNLKSQQSSEKIDRVTDDYRIPSGAGIGHVHLKVADIDRSLTFYRDLLGFTLVQRLPDSSAAFLAAGDYHHHVALNTWMSRGSTPANPRHTGLYHLAVR